MVLALSKGPEHPKKIVLFFFNLKIKIKIENGFFFFFLFFITMSTYVDVGERFITTCRQRKWLPTTGLSNSGEKCDICQKIATADN